MNLGQLQRIIRIEESIEVLKKDVLAITDGVKYTEELQNLHGFINRMQSKLTELEDKINVLELRPVVDAEPAEKHNKTSILSRFKSKKAE